MAKQSGKSLVTLRANLAVWMIRHGHENHESLVADIDAKLKELEEIVSLEGNSVN